MKISNATKRIFVYTVCYFIIYSAFEHVGIKEFSLVTIGTVLMSLADQEFSDKK